MRTLKKYVWLLRNARFLDILLYCFPGKMPVIRLEHDLLVLPQGTGIDITFPPKLFLLVKCTGFKFHSWLKDFLKASRISNQYVGRFRGYGRLALQLYRIDPTSSPVEDWLWLGALQHIAPEEWDEVDLWTIEDCEGSMPSLKRIIRRKMGLQFYQVQYCDTNYTVTINPVHMPDVSRITSEWEILSSCLCK